MKTVGMVACSNPLGPECRAEIRALTAFLERTGRRVAESRCMEALTGREKAGELMRLFACPDVTDICDISGGDMANEVLDFLDFEAIRRSRAVFWGYSDLTTLLNAIYAKTGKAGVLYQIRNLVGERQVLQQRRFLAGEELFRPECRMVQGEQLRGIVVGGNIRCFLKLAGTPYFPDLQEKVLLLEARSGQVPQMVTYLAQLRSCGVFGKIRGVLLGTFSEMEARGCTPDMTALVRSFVGADLPIAKTAEIGHGADARAIWIGKEIVIN